jgi:hypothetical protein
VRGRPCGLWRPWEGIWATSFDDAACHRGRFNGSSETSAAGFVAGRSQVRLAADALLSPTGFCRSLGDESFGPASIAPSQPRAQSPFALALGAHRPVQNGREDAPHSFVTEKPRSNSESMSLPFRHGLAFALAITRHN